SVGLVLGRARRSVVPLSALKLAALQRPRFALGRRNEFFSSLLEGDPSLRLKDGSAQDDAELI
ncbi:MAG: hypothetical protein WBX38_21085, partial [Candidatus Sulfotelmatobacter sp.]